MDTLIVILILAGFAGVFWYLRYEDNKRRAREKALTSLMETFVEGAELADTRAVELQAALDRLNDTVAQNRRIMESRFEGAEKNLIRATLKLTRYPVLRIREKGTGKYISLAIAEVIDPETGQVMPGTPVEIEKAD